jgi:fructose-1,6-bisphosphatase/inositol monophosphatase family enzyme
MSYCAPHPFSQKFSSEVELVESAILDAALYLVEEMASGRKPQVWVKPDHTLVMNIDLECQKRVLRELTRSGSPRIVAEEDEASHALIKDGGTYFLVDPLDGTTSCRRFFGEKGGHVGYGPLVGYVHENVLSVASFFSAPHNRLFTAVRGEGVYEVDIDLKDQSALATRRRLVATPCEKLEHAGVLFYLGTLGESKVMQLLRNENSIENMYRFGGFASDCARLARGTEQVSVQFSVKPWDFSGVLLCKEAGLQVYLDPLARKIPLEEWKIEMNNPCIIVQPSIEKELFSVLLSGKLAS